jgi:hypothetical protein
VSKERLERLLLIISEQLHGDKGAARATRLMRVPNTVNWKRGGNGKLTKYRVLSKTRYKFKDLESLWKIGEANDSAGRSPRRQSAKYAEFFAGHLENFSVSKTGDEGTALCPFHNDKRSSFSVNLKSGLWKCHSSNCTAQGNFKQLCERLKIQLPDTGKVLRFPRLRSIALKDEWGSEKVFQEAYNYLRCQIHFMHSWQPVVVTLWAMGTYLYLQFPCYGHLWLNSPTTHSGKSKLLSVLWTLCYKALEPQVEPTSAALFRFPSALGGTLLLDEVDNLDPQKRSDVISVLNSYLSNGVVIRATPGKNKKYTLEKLPTYCPKVIAGINNLPLTLQDRCIKIYLHRKTHSEEVERFMPGSFLQMEPLRNQLHAWATRDAMQIIVTYYRREQLGVPSHVDDRAKDILEPLFAVASVLPAWVKDELLEAADSIAKERTNDEQESNEVVRGLQILNEHFPERMPM